MVDPILKKAFGVVPTNKKRDTYSFGALTEAEGAGGALIINTRFLLGERILDFRKPPPRWPLIAALILTFLAAFIAWPR